MKKLIKSSAFIAATLLAGSAFAQLQDEKNVTITMDLQPVLQLKMEGPDNLEFTFDEISEYYSGITKYGATILKVSSSVNWDLWAAGLSNGSLAGAAAHGCVWDNPIVYGGLTTATLATNTTNNIPITALELRQFPRNSSIGTCAATVLGVAGTSSGSDYSLPFQPVSGFAVANVPMQVISSNLIYAPGAATPYSPPTSTNGATVTEKYIKGGSNGAAPAGCQGLGGSYLLNPSSSTLASTNPSAIGGGYYYVIDYRILPGLPAQFPATYLNAANNLAALTVPTALNAFNDAGGTAAGLYASGGYAAPGVYTMYVKYILAEDQ